MPVLLSPDMARGIDKIFAHRDRLLPATNSNKVFMLPNAVNPVEGWTALKKVTSMIEGLQQPHAITSTNMRKYIATVSQVRECKLAKG